MSAPVRESAAVLFDVVWRTLASVLGTSATATLVRRALRGAAQRRPELGLDRLVVVRADLEYRYAVPEDWRDEDPRAREALGFLLREEIIPLLGELTGPIGVRLVERIPELQRHGLVGARSES
jgi:hypothetical protein